MEVVVVLAELIDGDGSGSQVSLAILNNFSTVTEAASILAIEQSTEGGDVLIEPFGVVLIRKAASILCRRLGEREHGDSPALLTVGKVRLNLGDDFLVHLLSVDASAGVTESSLAVEPREKIKLALRAILPPALRTTDPEPFNNLKFIGKSEVRCLEGICFEQFGLWPGNQAQE